MAFEENDAPTWISDDGRYVIVTDPLDEEKTLLNSLQSGNRLIASGYVLYSSATILCITFGSGTHVFTLNRSTGDFILPNPSIEIPPHALMQLCMGVTVGVGIDKDGAHPDRVMQENWGGDIPMVQISPLQGQNVDDLLETIMLVAKTPAQVPD
ncbi:fructose-1,6-bisphosphatase, chloroplastic [Trifolium repens]|nr:fructose-1,6-bisphosphatase, chloroplastic [Trifolium repens]